MRTLLDEYGRNPIPDYYIPNLLPHLTREQLVYYNKMHDRQEGGPDYHDREQIRFPRDASGSYDPLSITLAPKSTINTFKYAGQARFYLGVTKVHLLDGTTEVRKCKVFNYTGKRILMIQYYNKKIEDEIRRVKGLASDH